MSDFTMSNPETIVVDRTVINKQQDAQNKRHGYKTRRSLCLYRPEWRPLAT